MELLGECYIILRQSEYNTTTTATATATAAATASTTKDNDNNNTRCYWFDYTVNRVEVTRDDLCTE